MTILNVLKTNKLFTLNFIDWYNKNNYHTIIDVNKFLTLELEFQLGLFTLYFNELNICLIYDNSGYVTYISYPDKDCILKYTLDDKGYKQIDIKDCDGIKDSIVTGITNLILKLSEEFKLEKEPF